MPSRTACVPLKLPLLLCFGLAALLPCTGCGESVRWYYDRNTAARDDRSEAQPTFVYFRSWYSVDCTRFEDEVLRDPQVVRSTGDLVCVMLSYDFDQPIATQWGVSQAPGIAVIAPTGDVLASHSGPATRDEVLEFLQRARQAWSRGAAAQPAAPRSAGPGETPPRGSREKPPMATP